MASGVGQGDILDTGKTCWEAPTVFYFVKNDCATAIPVTIKVLQKAAPRWGCHLQPCGCAWPHVTLAQAGDSVSCCRCRAAQVSFSFGMTHGMTHGGCVSCAGVLRHVLRHVREGGRHGRRRRRRGRRGALQRRRRPVQRRQGRHREQSFLTSKQLWTA